MKKVLGEGAFAKVKQAFSHKENREVAVKVFEKRRLPFDYLKRFLPREIRVLNALQHPNLVRFTLFQHLFYGIFVGFSN